MLIIDKKTVDTSTIAQCNQCKIHWSNQNRTITPKKKYQQLRKKISILFSEFISTYFGIYIYLLQPMLPINAIFHWYVVTMLLTIPKMNLNTQPNKKWT